MTIRALVLSGGGGRGAFHAGVYNYLATADKNAAYKDVPGYQPVDDAHNAAWIPDVIVGTSIGAVNGAAIAQGKTAQELSDFWLSLHDDDVEGLPPGMGWLARRAVNAIMRKAINNPLKTVPEDISQSPDAAQSWPPIPILPGGLSKRLIGQWSNLLDTGPLAQTLKNKLQLDTDTITNSAIKLLISATNVRTGEGMVFSNKSVIDRDTGQPRAGVRSPINIQRIIASCSIPMVYPWTEVDGETYWDGAVVANTPLGPVMDAVGDRPADEPMEAVVVMMTPWWESRAEAQENRGRLPQDFAEAMTWTLDWALLASFRAELKLLKSYNRLSEVVRNPDGSQKYRHVNPVIVAPDKLLTVQRIIDYDSAASAALIQKGEAAARRAFAAQFAVE